MKVLKLTVQFALLHRSNAVPVSVGVWCSFFETINASYLEELRTLFKSISTISAPNHCLIRTTVGDDDKKLNKLSTKISAFIKLESHFCKMVFIKLVTSRLSLMRFRYFKFEDTFGPSNFSNFLSHLVASVSVNLKSNIFYQYVWIKMLFRI